MKVEISKFAQRELEDAILYYELEQKGLGLRFKDEVKKSVDRIKIYPKAGSIEIGELRKCIVHKFPYKVLYSVQKGKIVVLAFAHQHRKPGYWLEERNI